MYIIFNEIKIWYKFVVRYITHFIERPGSDQLPTA